MSTNYTQFDWASDKQAREQFADIEERLMDGIDKRMRRRTGR